MIGFRPVSWVGLATNLIIVSAVAKAPDPMAIPVPISIS
jgi:hypothetical protein